jgi:hypothetical protein
MVFDNFISALPMAVNVSQICIIVISPYFGSLRNQKNSETI